MNYKKIFNSFLKKLNQFKNKLSNLINNKNKKYFALFEKIQITILYCFALLIQLYTVQNTLGDFPYLYYKLIPKYLLNKEFPIIKLISSPEKVFFVYFIVFEFIIGRPLGYFSILLKFNILFLFILELIQSVFFLCLDFLFSNEWEDNYLNIDTSIDLLTTPVCLTHIFFLFIYLYSYVQAIKGKIPKFPGHYQKIINSIAFWIKLKQIENPNKNK